MTIRRDEVSWGALALILCLALPMGILSRFAPRTTADEVDAADSVIVARVTAMQTVRTTGVTLLQFELDHMVAGLEPERRFGLQVHGRPALEVGDLVLSMISFDPPSLLGAYQVRKDPRSLEYKVHSPITGLSAEGVYDVAPLSVDHVEDAIRLRRGLSGRSPRGSRAAPPAGDADEESDSRDASGKIASIADDHGNTIGTATPVVLKLPHLITGMPTKITGCLVPGDVDYFSFDAPILSLLHAETLLPEGLTSVPPDTFMGLFDAASGDLLAYDDDSGAGNYSRFVIPIEETALYAVAVEGAPDPDLVFDGADGQQTGPYTLSLELEQGAYLANFLDLIVGVSPDGTFIEDFVGFKRVDGVDVLRAGVEGDGWGLEYDARLPSGLSHVYGGSGDFLVQPSFNAPVERSLFSIGYFGDNRRGHAESQTGLPYQTHPRRVVTVGLGYNVLLSQSVVHGRILIKVATTDRIQDIEFRRLMDVDLFGVGADTFFWSFRPGCDWLVYPTAVTESLDAPTPPPTGTGEMTGDLQVALVANAGTVTGAGPHQAVTIRFPVAFTLVDQFVNKLDAVQSAVQNLLASNTETWTVAVDVDPSTGLYTAFGVGMGQRVP